jgi:hypothetical protein
MECQRLLAGTLIVSALGCATAQAQSNMTPRISLTRIEFTRPAGLPGAAREIAPANSPYLMAVPTEEPRIVARKKKKK